MGESVRRGAVEYAVETPQLSVLSARGISIPKTGSTPLAVRSGDPLVTVCACTCIQASVSMVRGLQVYIHPEMCLLH